MRIEVARAFVSEGYSLDIDCLIDIGEDQQSVFGNTVASPVHVCGRLYNKAEVLHLVLDTGYTLTGQCDRCCEDVKISRKAHVETVLVRSKENEENDELIEVKDDQFDITDLVTESIMLDVPYKLLCSEDCKGLCPFCGQDLNKKNCGCRKASSPFDILKQEFKS